MHDTNARGRREAARGLRGAKWVLDLAQMPDHGHFEAARVLAAGIPAAAVQWRSRLVDDANLSSKSLRDAPARELLQRNQPVGACDCPTDLWAARGDAVMRAGDG